jgi:hypothetical protein
MGVFAGRERQCTEDEHDDEDENDSQISEFGFNLTSKESPPLSPFLERFLERSALRLDQAIDLDMLPP